MPIGISEADVKRINDQLTQQDIFGVDNVLDPYLRELDPWLPVNEDTPKDRPLLLYMDKGPLTCRQWIGCSNGNWPWPPTHWKELPADPV